MSDSPSHRSPDPDISAFLQEMPPLNPALVQGNCNVAPLPHPETQGDVDPPIETPLDPRRR